MSEKLSPAMRKIYEQEINTFFKFQPCRFFGWKPLQDAYKNAIENLGPGCSRCQKNALKRKYIVKIERVFVNAQDPMT